MPTAEEWAVLLTPNPVVVSWCKPNKGTTVTQGDSTIEIRPSSYSDVDGFFWYQTHESGGGIYGRRPGKPIVIEHLARRMHFDLDAPISVRVHDGGPTKTNPFAPRERTPPTQLVYFIVAETMNCIKIGVATCVASRMRDHQTSCPDKLSLIHQMPGGHKLEHRLHRKFASDHVRGEWFRFSQDIRSFIEENANA